MPKKEKKFVAPKTLGACADLLYKTRAARLAIYKTAEDLEELESKLKEHLINVMPKTDTGASGKVAKVVVETKKVPQVKDWDAFYKHIKKTGDFALLGKGLGKEHVKEVLDAGKKVPGLGSVPIITVSLTKL